MRTIKWAAAIIMIIVLAANSYAQSARTPADQAKQLQIQLKLTDPQTNKITAILQQIDKDQSNDKTAQANFKNWQATRNMKAMIDYVLKQIDVNEYKIEQVLTVNQKSTFHQIVEKRRDGLRKMEAAQR